MYLKTWILGLLLVTLKMIHPTISLEAFCSDSTMFANNSAYQTNLNTLFHYLSSNTTNNPSGFYRTTVGNPKTEAVYGHYLCRGEVNISACHGCVSYAINTDLPTGCPNRKNAIIWYDRCMVRYSNVSFFDERAQGPEIVYWNAMPLLTDENHYMATLVNMVSKHIAVQAAEGGPLKKFATAFENISVVQPIYGYGQCTPDLTRADCFTCLNLSIQSFNASPGCRVLAPSCVVRYEPNPFFNLSFLPPLAQQPLPSPSASPPRKKKVSTKVVVLMIVAALLVLSAALFSMSIYLVKNKSKKDDVLTNTQISDQDFTVKSLQYDLETLLNATNNFSNKNKLGQGGFGEVYKGTLSNGKLIAIKRLSAGSSQGIQEFKTEVFLLSKLHHRNLVRLLGFCYEGQEKLLVYEYVANKSLDHFIFDQENRRQLDWQKRWNIIKGIARGLLYLHHDSQLRIIHRDVKASNILMDEAMNPKISDFGTARIFGVDHSQSNHTERVLGTYGYMAPEYALHGKYSIKSDAYSFGVLVLEIVSGQKNTTFNQFGDTVNLQILAWKQWEDRTPLEFVDPTIRDSCSDYTDEVMRCIHLGLLCVQESVEDRPTMANVVLTLESYTVTLPKPEQPEVFARNRRESPFSNNVGSDNSPLSLNDDSITELEPR